LASSGRAAIIFQYVADAHHYVGAGGNVTVKLYLQETDTQGSPSLIASEMGLFGAGVVVAQAGGSPSGARLTTISAVADNKLTHPDGFDSGNNIALVYNNNKNARILENVVVTANSGPSGTTNGGSVTMSGTTRVTDVFLGTVTIMPGDPSSTTSFDVMPYVTFFGHDGNTVSVATGFDFDVSHTSAPVYTGADSFIVNPFVFDVSGAPEPSTLSLGVLLLAAGAALRARRRWRPAAAHVTPPGT
jgi:hypothetical protein